MIWNEMEYPRCFVTLADELATLRTMHSKHIYKEGTEKYRGDKEHKISMLGILAELIARHHLEDGENQISVAPLVEENPIVGADITLYGIGEDYFIDVKGVKKSSEYLRVNYKAHNNPNKKITHYMFIQPITRQRANYCFVTKEELNDWEIVESTYTKCYRKKINEKIY
jgi:hypothetical protein